MTQIMAQKKPGEQSQVEMARDDVPVFIPRVDIFETDDEIVLNCEMPGVAIEDIDIQFEDRKLTLLGKVPARHVGCTLFAAEYGIGDFQRTFTIGEAIDVEKIAADLENGVLKLRLPKSEAVKPRKIAVKAI